MAPVTLPSLAATVAKLTERVAELEEWRDQIIALAASREKRIAEIEAYVRSNDARITELAISDEASGWKRWRENRVEA